MNAQRFVSAALDGHAEHTEHIGPGSDRTGELRRLAGEALSHEKESLRLRTLLNVHAPISRLPPEILSLIFLHYAAVFQEEQFTNYYIYSPHDEDIAAHKQIYTWHNVARVCRGWREVALQCALLWRCLVIDERVPEGLLKTFLERSQGVPLTVIAHGAHQDNHCDACVHSEDPSLNLHAGVMLLGQIIERTAQLNLYLRNLRYDVFWPCLMGSGGMLRSLHIEAIGDASYERHLLYRQPPSVVVPSVLFTVQQPPLQTLSFLGIGLAWNNVLFCATLRRLDIAKCLVVGGTGIAADMGDLLNALRGTPHLEELAIDSYSFPNSDPRTEYHLVDLPRLRRLRVPNRHNNSMNLVEHLRLPQDAAIHFAGENTETFDVDVLAAYTAGLPRILDGMQVYAISHYSGSSHNHCKLWAKASPSQDPAPPHDALAPTASEEADPTWEATAATPPRLRIDCALDSGVVQALLRSLDVQHIRILSVATQPIDYRLWAEIFAPATHVTTLRVQGPGAFALGAALAGWKRPSHINPPGTHAPHDHVGFGALLDDGDGDGDEDARVQHGYTPGPPLFPRLRNLCIAAIDFPLAETVRGRRYRHREPFLWIDDMSDDDEGGNGGNVVRVREPYGLNVASVLKSLRVRTKIGAAELVRLSFEHSQCWERERLAPLVAAVREVWWDGERLTSDELGKQVIAGRGGAYGFWSASRSEYESSDGDWFE